MGYLDIADHFEEMILRGALRVGERLPSTTVLSKQFSVSPQTIQRGLNRLASKGLVARKPRVGTVVCGSLYGAKCLAVAFGSDPFQIESPFYRLILSALLAEGTKNDVTVKPFYHLDSRLSHDFFTDIERRYADGEINCVLKLCSDTALNYWSSANKSIPYLRLPTYDISQIARVGAAHLLERGCRRIVTLSLYGDGSEDAEDVKRERAGVEAAFNRFGLDPKGALPVQCGQTEESAYGYMMKVLAERKSPDAVLVLHDVTCRGVIMAILENGLRIPDDIALVTHSNKGAEIAVPVKLTTIQVDPARIAADIMSFVKNNALKPGENILSGGYEAELIQGEST